MPEPPLAMERDALRQLLTRLMSEVNDLETLCKHGPRIVSVATNTARVQAALESLRDRTPALVWKSARGEYSVQDSSMLEWFMDLSERGGWPPSEA